MSRRLFLIIVLCLGLPVMVQACLWDYDTLQMERSRFPDTLELITGKFLRHSPEFYRWRIADRLERLKSEPDNVRLLDDLGVAYDKVGEHEKAIATAHQIEQIQPGRYETQANLGTFLIHAGQFEQGLPYLKRAIEINPQAHFGREIYQIKLVEYVSSRRKNGQIKLPLNESNSSSYQPRGLAKFLDEADLADALRGVQGMMKFGQYDSPILLEALGDLLLSTPSDGKLLAARAYLKASYDAKTPEAKAAYREKAEQALAMQTPSGEHRSLKLAELEPTFLAELAEAKQWYAELAEKEKGWIASGQNPEAEFDKLYTADPQITSTNEPPGSLGGVRWSMALGAGCFLVFGAVTAAAGLFIWRIRSRRRARSLIQND